MDFASLMTRELAKAKPTSTSPTPVSSAAAAVAAGPAGPYLKKAEIEAQRQRAYAEEQAAIRREREEKHKRKRQLEDDEAARKQERDDKRRRLAEESRQRREEEDARKEKARRKRLGLPELPAKADPDDEESQVSSETEAQKAITLANANLPIPTTLELLPEDKLKVPAVPPKDLTALPYLYRQLASYFTLLLRAWSSALASRPSSVADTTAGRAALNAYTSSLTNLRPLFTHFERSSLDAALLAPLLEIVAAAQMRRYVDANDAYLRLSIGKAAWPIGVTMVGIHERSAREKIGDGAGGGVAHIMSDEGTRKWLQSLKRCLSFAQTRWPPEDIGQLMG